MFLSAKFLVVLLITTMLFVSCSRQESVQQTPAERGKYLVTLGGCHDCHTPKVQGPNGAPMLDETKLLSGHPENLPAPSWSPKDIKEKGVAVATNASLTAWAGPWGVSFAANLTPDKDTGIAEWSEQMFIQVARTGKHQGQPNGRDILPPMPWFNLKDLSDADLRAVWSYLKSIPPVKNRVPLPLLPRVAEERVG
jgi:mono/diheme cytochrome c family protein